MIPFYIDTSEVNITSNGTFIYYKSSVVNNSKKNIDKVYSMELDSGFNFKPYEMWMSSEKMVLCGLINEKLKSKRIHIITEVHAELW